MDAESTVQATEKRELGSSFLADMFIGSQLGKGLLGEPSHLFGAVLSHHSQLPSPWDALFPAEPGSQSPTQRTPAKNAADSAFSPGRGSHTRLGRWESTEGKRKEGERADLPASHRLEITTINLCVAFLPAS